MKMTTDRVSVIIPVYNVEKYIAEAIESALNQPAVGEIILVNDGFPDGAWDICHSYADRYPVIRLVEHPNGENRGAAASRNAGIREAKFDYISFLDADDYFLSNRFARTFNAFRDNPAVSAVYEPVGTVFETEQAKSTFAKWRNIDLVDAEHYLTYPKKTFDGRFFLISLLKGNNGSPHLNGITFSKSLIEEVGYFNESLRLHQDSEFWVRAAYYGRFSPVEEPIAVAVRRVHEDNRITYRNFDSRFLRDASLYKWAKKNVDDRQVQQLIKKNYAISSTFSKMKTNNILARIFARIKYISL